MTINWHNDGSGFGTDEQGRMLHDGVYREPVKGAKAGSKEPRKPSIAKDSAASVSTAKLLYGLSEGEIAGLVDGGKSIYLDGTPLLDEQGNNNFDGITWDFREGTIDQEHISGFPDVSNEIPIGTELRSSAPWIKSFTDPQLSAVRVRLRWNRLSKTDPETGDVKGHRIDYAIDLQTNGGSYVTVLNTKIEDKTSVGYERTHRIDLPRSPSGWQIRIRRLTANNPSEYVSDSMFVDAVAEVIDVKLRYPNTAMLGVQYNAELFSNIAKIGVHAKGMIIRVPSNYDPVARTYTGIWDGTFKDAYTNNPAWIFFDLCTQWRYGLGERLDLTMIDKWSLYELGQYCDQMVSDGQGGLEPRFTCNVYLQKQADAYQVLANLAGIFRALSYWNGEQIVLDADVPQDPVYTFTRSNVIDGNFEYSGSRHRDRHTIVRVAWDNPSNNFETEYEFIRDEKAMAKYGTRVLDLAAFGCTSQAQAQRAGIWALKTEQLETRQVSFQVGLDGINCQVGNIINVSDELLAGRANGGRVAVVSAGQTVVTIDRDATIKAGDVLIINGSDGKAQRREVKSVSGRKVTVVAAFTTAEVENVWAVESDELRLMRFRVMTIKETENDTYSISALQHEPQKFDAIDYGTDVKPTNITIVKPESIVDAPAEVTITMTSRVIQGISVASLNIAWGQVKEAAYYIVEWKKDDGAWIQISKVTSNSTSIEGIYSGVYTARVRAVSAFDVQSPFRSSVATQVAGKVGTPPTLASLKATGVLFGVELEWTFKSGSGDTAFTEIQVASAPNTNVKLLAQYAYSTNKASITGLQGGLTQYYRGRLIDKLGNASAYTAWVSATTDDSAEKVLEILEGQITESQLFNDLKEKINSAADGSMLEEINEAIRLAQEAIEQADSELEQANLDIAAAQSKADAAANSAAANKTTLTALSTTVGNNKTSVDQSITTLTDKDTALTQLYTALQSEFDGNKASVSQKLTTLTEKDASLSTLITNLTSEYNTNKASVTQSLSTLTTANSSNAQSLTGLTTRMGNNETAVTNEVTNRTNADNALSARISTNLSKAENALGRITTAETTIASNTQSIASTETELTAKFDNLSIGGRNLLKYDETIQRWASAFGSSQVMRTGVAVTEWRATDAIEGIYAGGTREHKTVIDINVGKGTLFTWSCYIKNTTGSAISFQTNGIVDGTITPNIIENNAWARVVITGTCRTTYEWCQVFVVTNSVNTTAKFIFWHEKLELGNKATDWSPSFDDINSAISINTANLSQEAIARANEDNALGVRITNNESKTNNAISRIGTAENTIASNTAAVAKVRTDLTSTFDALEVGGTNLISRADDYWRWGGAYGSDSTHTKGITVAEWETSDATQVVYSGGTNITRAATHVKVGKGVLCTWSCYIKNVSGGTLTVNTNGLAAVAINQETIPNNTAARIIITGVCRTSYDWWQMFLTASSTSSNAKIYFWHEKVEKGNKATDWSISPLELEAADAVNATAISNEKIARTNQYGSLASDISTLRASTQKSTVLYNFNMRFDWNNWTNYSGAGELTTSSAAGMILGNNSGDDQRWMIRNENIPVIRGVVYKITARIKNVSGSGATYIGVAGVADDGVTFVNNGDTDGYSNQYYTHYNNDTNPEFINAVGYVASSDTDLSGFPQRAMNLRSRVAFIRPLIIANYAGKSGITYIDYFNIETVDANSVASLQEVKEVVSGANGLTAQWSLKLDVNGYVSGVGQYNNGTTSQFAILATQFYIANPSKNTADTPFQVLTSNTVVNGVTVPAGVYMKEGYIKNASIDLAKINTASIGSLTALSTTIGHFRSATTGARLEIKDSLLSVYDSNNKLRVRLGLW